ncbi:MAG: DUF3824 domain-containing protein [Candidatus Coatesbacteria bacterium]
MYILGHSERLCRLLDGILFFNQCLSARVVFAGAPEVPTFANRAVRKSWEAAVERTILSDEITADHVELKRDAIEGLPRHCISRFGNLLSVDCAIGSTAVTPFISHIRDQLLDALLTRPWMTNLTSRESVLGELATLYFAEHRKPTAQLFTTTAWKSFVLAQVLQGERTGIRDFLSLAEYIEAFPDALSNHDVLVARTRLEQYLVNALPELSSLPFDDPESGARFMGRFGENVLRITSALGTAMPLVLEQLLSLQKEYTVAVEREAERARTRHEEGDDVPDEPEYGYDPDPYDDEPQDADDEELEQLFDTLPVD